MEYFPFLFSKDFTSTKKYTRPHTNHALFSARLLAAQLPNFCGTHADFWPHSCRLFAAHMRIFGRTVAKKMGMESIKVLSTLSLRIFFLFSASL
jgi:hypothetical protein